MLNQQIIQMNNDPDIKRLVERREQLRSALRKYFCMSVSQRNYAKFELVVNELDEVRTKILRLKGMK